MRAARPIVFVSAIIVAGAALSGCSTIAQVARAQSHAAACLQIDAQLTAVGKAMESKVPELKTDPKGAATDIAHDAVVFSAATKKLSNPAVKRSAMKAASEFTTFSDDLTALADTPNTTTENALESELPKLQSALVAIDTTCKQ
jgi:hypothetical protein